MRFELTQHARDALIKRGISMEWLERAVKSPDHTEPDATDPNYSIGWRSFPKTETACFVL